jgi:hypothetical protein
MTHKELTYACDRVDAKVARRERDAAEDLARLFDYLAYLPSGMTVRYSAENQLIDCIGHEGRAWVRQALATDSADRILERAFRRMMTSVPSGEGRFGGLAQV